jgi:hypothetical protein
LTVNVDLANGTGFLYSLWTITATGAQGVSGFSGVSGATGGTGTSGFSGVSGYSGTNGGGGASGVSGFSGYSGTNGTGTSGFSGYSGAAGPAGRGGYTAVTLTASSPNATLTSGSNQLIMILNDNTTPVTPSVTLPAMTTLSTGFEYFVFSNTTPFVVALKDNGGTVREYIPSGANYTLNIKDISTSTGQWFTEVPVIAVEGDPRYTSFLSASFKVTNSSTSTGPFICRLDSTNFAAIWAENAAFGTTATVYARLYTLNTATKTFTTGNTITAHSFGYSDDYGAIRSVAFDSDDAGHALVTFQAGYAYAYFGLSVFGGTLYASTTTVVAGPTLGPCTVGSVVNMYAGYLGSNSAYALCWGAGPETSSATYLISVRGVTVTGTTTVTVTESASNTSLYTIYGLGAGNGALYGARTGLTTFVFGAGPIATPTGKAVTYTPASNTFTVVNRSNLNRLDIEQGSTASLSSFAQGGFMFSNNKVFFGTHVFDVTNVGAAGVTATLSTGFNYKLNPSSAYASINGAGFVTTTLRSSVYATTIISVDVTSARYQCDTTSTTLNMQRSNGYLGTARSGFTYGITMLNATTAVSVAYTSGAANVSQAVIATPVTISTPITA